MIKLFLPLPSGCSKWFILRHESSRVWFKCPGCKGLSAEDGVFTLYVTASCVFYLFMGEQCVYIVIVVFRVLAEGWVGWAQHFWLLITRFDTRRNLGYSKMDTDLWQQLLLATFNMCHVYNFGGAVWRRGLNLKKICAYCVLCNTCDW